MFVICFKQKTAYEMRISYWSSDVCSSDLRRTEDCRQLLLQPLLGPDRGVHPHRIGDAKAREGVDLQTLLVGRQHLLALHVDAQDALVDLLDRIGEGHTDDEPGARAAEILSRLIPVDRKSTRLNSSH